METEAPLRREPMGMRLECVPGSCIFGAFSSTRFALEHNSIHIARSIATTRRILALGPGSASLPLRQWMRTAQAPCCAR
jgi:hypothetical protein